MQKAAEMDYTFVNWVTWGFSIAMLNYQRANAVFFFPLTSGALQHRPCPVFAPGHAAWLHLLPLIYPWNSPYFKDHILDHGCFVNLNRLYHSYSSMDLTRYFFGFRLYHSFFKANGYEDEDEGCILNLKDSFIGFSNIVEWQSSMITAGTSAGQHIIV